MLCDEGDGVDDMGHTAYENIPKCDTKCTNYLLEIFRQIKENYFKLVVDRVLEILGFSFLEVR